MKKINLLYILILSLYGTLVSQNTYDTLIDKGIYKSYFNTTLKIPIFVTHKLYQGGGEASRYGDNFTNDTKIKMLAGKDYAGLGFDKGHLANAEDFAYDDSLQNLTFRYYNCVPQNPTLNRGKWRSLETKARRASALDTMFIVNIVVYTGVKVNNICIPSVCYKALYNYETCELLWVVGYKNDAQSEEVFVTDKIKMLCHIFLDKEKQHSFVTKKEITEIVLYTPTPVKKIKKKK